MNETTTIKGNMLKVAGDLKGRAVLKSDTGEKLGQVEDVIINPGKGQVLGIALQTAEGAAVTLAARDYIIGPDAVMVAPGALKPATQTGDALAGGVNSGVLVGATVVTEDGKLLGRVNEVYISAEFPGTVYHVVESTLQRFFGGGFFLAGNVPRAYSMDGARLIVPADTEDRFARPSLAEVVESSASGVGSAVRA